MGENENERPAVFVYRHAQLDSARAVLIAPIVEHEHRKASGNEYICTFLRFPGEREEDPIGTFCFQDHLVK